MATLARLWAFRAGLVFLAVRVVSVVMLTAMAAQRGLPVIDRLTAWDGQWYLQLAEHGYRGMTGTLDAAGQPYADAPLGFFPCTRGRSTS
ncbi:hypothetical protein [Amycolatopsis decaplanina]|uniref:Uncharacterized protein n=1 Tax=Amycolatopsis decaplanina DSM 44594 TaxID=1284240 RepID=M2YT92_9PSEU|nr:hypothetical protein [Amycolatopsis decaplanina]EME51978.1 hypothetical protein H074_34503 [Amycolatopsis decaplanina DSM 44594]